MKNTIYVSISILVLFAMLLVSCSSATTPTASEPEVEEPVAEEPVAEEPEGFDWKKYEGTEITLLLNEHPWTDELRNNIDEFEELTGIKVDLQAFAEDLYFDKMELAVRADEGVADVYFEPMDAFSYVQWTDGLIAPLSPYLNDPTLTSPDYDLEDFPEGFLEVAMFPSGDASAELHGIPITFEAYILFYNQELVDKHLDGEVPQTMDELVAAATKIAEEGDGEYYGAVLRGQRDAITADLISALVANCLGGDPTPLPYGMYFDGDWTKPLFTDPNVEKGFTQYAALMQAGPPNVLAMDWYESSNSFAQGKAAFYIDASLFSPGFENADESAVAGKVGYVPIPVCNDQPESYTTNWMWGLGIPENAENKEAGWYFIQWATNKELDAKLGVATGGPGRISTWSNQEFTSTLNQEFVKAVEVAMQTSRPAAVFYENWGEIALGITDAVHEIYNGAEAGPLLQELQDMTLEITSP